jgi:hypothetical protein
VDKRSGEASKVFEEIPALKKFRKLKVAKL